MKEARHERCSTCGRKRGLSPRRESWGITKLPLVPRTNDPEDKAWQVTNDLICHAGVYRNGGTSEDSHLCDECLRIGLLAIKLEVDRLLDSFDEGREKDAELADLRQRLGATQHRLSNLAHDHNRMQDRLRDVLEIMDAQQIEESEAIKYARWEAGRRPAEWREPALEGANNGR